MAWRFLHFATLMVLFGAALFRLHAVGDFQAPPAVRRAFRRWLWRLSMVAAVAALISALGWLVAITVDMTGDVAEALDFDAIAMVLTETEFGLIWLCRLAILSLLVVLLAVIGLAGSGLRGSGNSPRRAIAILAGLALASLSGVGHAIMDAGTASMVHQVADAVHLLAAAVWLGGLVALSRLLAGAATDPDWTALARHALPRFSAMALVAVGLVVASGVANTAFLLDSPGALLNTAYGRVLFAKVALVVLMIALGALNRQVLLPRIASTARSEVLIPLRRSVTAEIALGVAVLALVGALGTLAPDH